MPEHEHVLINDTLSQYATADPTQNYNLRKNIDILTSNKCDVGFAFDTDGDRICIINNQGIALSIDHILMLFIKHINNLSKKIVIIDVKMSTKVSTMAEQLVGW